MAYSLVLAVGGDRDVVHGGCIETGKTPMAKEVATVGEIARSKRVFSGSRRLSVNVMISLDLYFEVCTKDI